MTIVYIYLALVLIYANLVVCTYRVQHVVVVPSVGRPHFDE